MTEVKAAVASLQAELQAETERYFPAHDNRPTPKALEREEKIRVIGAALDNIAQQDPKLVQLRAAEQVVLNDYMATTQGGGRGDKAKLKAWWDANASTERYQAEVNRKLLEQIRPMGPQGDKSKYDNVHIMTSTGDTSALDGAIAKAIEYYPSEWIDTFHDWDIVLESEAAGNMPGTGGYFEPLDERGKIGHIHLTEPKPATAAHEIGHVMERTRRALPQAEWVFLMRRAQNQEPGVDIDYPNGLTYIDEFMDGYIGHAYYADPLGRPDPSARGYRVKTFEVFTRGMEWVTGYGKMMRTQQKKDADFRAFVIGALAVL
jgi:hypothetical protein